MHNFLESMTEKKWVHRSCKKMKQEGKNLGTMASRKKKTRNKSKYVYVLKKSAHAPICTCDVKFST